MNSRKRRGVLVALVLIGLLLGGAALIHSTRDWYLPAQTISIHSDAVNEVNGQRLQVWVDGDSTARLRIGTARETTGLEVGDSARSGWWGRLTVVTIKPGGAPVDGVQPPGSGLRAPGSGLRGQHDRAVDTMVTRRSSLIVPS